MQTMTELQTPVLYPAVQDFLSGLAAAGGPPLHELSPQEAREVLRGLQSGSIAKLPADLEDRDLPVGPNGKVPIRIVRPKGAKEILPAVMYFHGGGWVLGDKDTHDFVMLNALADTPAARGAIAQAVGALRQAFVR